MLFFNKTYGFIRCDEYEEDIFFKYKDISSSNTFRQVFSGDYVTFDIVKNKDRLRATNVQNIDEFEDGKKIIKVLIFPLKDNTFALEKFYQRVISRIPEGLKYSKIVENKMIITSDKVNDDILAKIVKKQSVENYFIKYL